MKVPEAALLGLLALFTQACPGPSVAPEMRDVDLPGIDTTDFTPRERHEFSTYVSEFPAPCGDLAVPVAQCVLEKRACPSCTPAAQLIAKAVRDGMSREQVRELYANSTMPLAGSPSRGPENAPVVLVEFADFECPFCQKLAPLLDDIWEKRKDKLRFVYKYLPLGMHKHGEPAARAAIAAQMQGKFWEMHHLLFANGEHLEADDLVHYAQSIGLDVERFQHDMDSDAATSRIKADRKLADDLKVNGTPMIYVDGQPYDLHKDLDEFVDAEIAAHTR
jgi:protein-disulfide isomerase